MTPSTIIQLLLLLLASGAFALAFQLGIRYMRTGAAGVAALSEDRPAVGAVPAGDRGTTMGSAAASATTAGVALILVLLAWRAAGRAEGFVRLDNYFDSFLTLAMLLTAMLVYFRVTHHLRTLGFFLLPLVTVVLLLGAILALITRDGQFADGRTPPILLVHVFSIMLGSVLFAAGCAGGILYLVGDRQLRNKGLDRSHRFLALPSLATIEKFNQTVTLLGFPLLTIAMITGFMRAYAAHHGGAAGAAPAGKVLLAVLAWLVYAVVLHVRLAPSFRGRKAAWLSIIGFVLLLAVFLATTAPYWWPR